MAKRLDDDEAIEAPVERKRRRPKKQPVSDDDEDGGASGTRKKADESEDVEEEDSISTGNVVLDILLDFRDDCYYWAQDHFALAVILGIVVFLCSLAAFGLTVRSIIAYINRPKLATAVVAYDLGAYGEAKRYAEEVLKYVSPEDYETRSMCYFIMGASSCSIAEIAWTSNRQPFYLVAANYLGEANKLGFPPARRAEANFLYGKSLYLSGELTRCRAPLHLAWEQGAANRKMIAWYLTNSYFLAPQPNLVEAIRHLRSFQGNPLVTEDEKYEADLLQTMILLQMNEIEAAEKAFRKVPKFDRYKTMRDFVSGQIAFYQARRDLNKAVELEKNRNPIPSPQDPRMPGPVAPIPVPPSERQAERDANQPTEIRSDQRPTDPLEPAQAPFDDPDSQKLLPATEISAPPLSEPSSSAWPPDPAAGSPWAVVSPETFQDDSIHVDTLRIDKTESVEQHSTYDSPLIRRMSWSARQAPVPEKADGKKAGTEKATVEKTVSETLDPNAVIVLPHDIDSIKPQAPTPAPVPPPLPEGVREPSFVDSNTKRARQLRDNAEEKYREAIALFRQVRQSDTFVPRWLRTAMLLEGICHEEIGELQTAQKVFLDLYESYPSSSETTAANFFWAEIERNRGRLDTALTGYARAFDALRKDPQFSCPWLSKEEMQERSGELVREQLRLRDYPTVLTLLYLLREIMPAADLANFRCEVYESWADDLRRQLSVTVGNEGEKIEKEMLEKYCQAGKAFEEFARHRFGQTDYDVQLWRAAESYRLGRDYRNSIPLYREYLHVNWRDRQAEALYRLGEMFIHIDGLNEAVEYLERALRDYPNHSLVPRIRLALSRAYYERKDWDKARQLLQQNLLSDYAPTAAIYRDSMYALGKLFYERGDRTGAIAYLEDAVNIHPNAVQAADAHYCLSQAFLERAEKTADALNESPLEDVRRAIDEEIASDLRSALHHIQKAEVLLIRRQNAIGLTPSEELMLRNALFGTGNILMRQKRYDRAISAFDIAATRYRDRPEVLDALLQIALAYRQLGQPGDALPVLNRAEVLLNQLEKNGTIPKQNRWGSQIKIQRNILLTNEQSTGIRP